jgi:CPA2 family monovalent cation:H+ antiporter-2
MDLTILNDIGIIFGLSIFILLIFSKFKIPSVLGFLVTGMLVGPYGMGIISKVTEVEALAEIGIILLLFTIGVELSIKDLWDIKRSVLLGGLLQVLSTIFIVYYGCTYFGFNSNTSIFIGFLISLSSTAIVLKLLQEKGEVYTPHGKTSLAILIFQDIIIVPMILVTPILAGTNTGAFDILLVLLLKAVGIIALVIISARWILPALLYQVVKTRNKELFLLTIISICLATAWLTSSAGLSLSLGAFIAGLVISESEYSHQAIGNLIPLRDIFMSLFFVSIGMLLNIRFFSDNLFVLMVLALGVIFAKSITSSLVTFILGYPLRTTILTGMMLAQVGEFSFVLSKYGLDLGLIDNKIYQAFLAVTITTMAFTPFVVNISNTIADQTVNRTKQKIFINGLYTTNSNTKDKKIKDIQDHLIIVGYGFNGKTLASAAKNSGINYMIIEMNPETVRHERKLGENIYYGDASHEGVLHSANVATARILIVGISDYIATRKIVGLARKMNPQIHIIARTRYLKEMKALYDIGANEVIPEEYETSVEIFVRLLKKYLVPEDKIDKFTKEVRANGYCMLRTTSCGGQEIEFNIEKELPGFEVLSLHLEEKCPLEGKKLEDADLRNKYDVTILAIKRGTDIISNPKGKTQLCSNDICILLGRPEMIHNVRDLFIEKKSQ